MERRQFINRLTMGAAAATALGASAAQAEREVTISSPSGEPAPEHPGLPGDIQPQLFVRLYRAIEVMQGFNNHLHHGDEKLSLAWYYPHKVAGKSNIRSKGQREGLKALLELDENEIDNVELVHMRYLACLDKMSIREFYHHLADLTHDQYIAFITEPADKMNAQLQSDRLKLVVHTDQYLFPLQPEAGQVKHPSHANRYGVRRASLEQMIGLLDERPESFEQYLNFVNKAIARTKSIPGAIGAKWGFSYYRTFDIDISVTKDEAQAVYDARDTRTAAYKKLQDYLAVHTMRAMADEGLPVQIHTGLGADPGLSLADTQPALLDRFLSHPELQHARICLIHGGYPFCKEIGVMLERTNVWMDFSWMVLLLSPNTLAGYLKEWIEVRGPWEILYGIDACGIAQIEGAWTARRALALALTRMIQEDQIDYSEALGYAQGMLRNNALNFYQLNL